MAKEKTKKTRGLAMAAGVLAAVIGVGAVVGVGYSTNWFRKTDEVLDTTASEESGEEANVDNVVINNGVSTAKLSISSARTASLTSSILNGDGNSAEYVEDSITLTANYNSAATNPTFTWTCTDTTHITITPSSDTKSCTVTCSSAFSTQATITCTATDDETVYATCTVDYIKRPSRPVATVTNTGGDDFTFTVSSGSATWKLPAWTESTYGSSGYSLKCSDFSMYYHGTGTIEDTYTLKSLSCTKTDASANVYTFDIANSAVSYYTILYVLTSGIYPTSITNVASIYNYFVSTPTCILSATYVSDTTGISYNFSFTLKVDVSNLYTAVSSVSLSNTAIAF